MNGELCRQQRCKWPMHICWWLRDAIVGVTDVDFEPRVLFLALNFYFELFLCFNGWRAYDIFHLWELSQIST